MQAREQRARYTHDVDIVDVTGHLLACCHAMRCVCDRLTCYQDEILFEILFTSFNLLW